MTQPQYTPAFLARFWSKVDRNGPIPDYAPHLGPCWLWTVCLSEKGYGLLIVKLDGSWKCRKAHRIAWAMRYGEIPMGLELDHLCRVRHCVNPDHLEPVDTKTNVLRGVGISAGNAKKTFCAKGHSDWEPDGRFNWRRCRSCQRRIPAAPSPEEADRG